MKYQVRPSAAVPGAWVVYTRTGNVLVTAFEGIAQATAFALNGVADGKLLGAANYSEWEQVTVYTGPTEGI